MLTEEDGRKFLKYVRDNLTSYLKTGKEIPAPEDLKSKFSEKQGAFVTYKKKGKGDLALRGCIGIVLPYYPLFDTIKKMSITAATDDPRFPAIKESELENLVIEISVLSVPKLIEVNSAEEYLNKIKIGVDGLIVKKGPYSGLLLPRVPIEQTPVWDVKTFLDYTCIKAGLPRNAWKDIKSTKIESFQAQVFNEEH